jgi:hypothetical protein
MRLVEYLTSPATFDCERGFCCSATRRALVIPLTDLNTGHEVTYSKQLHDYVSAGGMRSHEPGRSPGRTILANSRAADGIGDRLRDRTGSSWRVRARLRSHRPEFNFERPSQMGCLPAVS